MEQKSTHGDILALVPTLTKEERQEILAYYVVNEKYEKEIAEIALKDLEKHPVFGELIRSIPEEMREAQNKISRQLQRDAIVNDNWIPYIEYSVAQGSTYAKMGIDFKSWYDLISLAKDYITPYLYKVYGNGADFISALNGMNRFIDIGMGLIGEAYLREKQEIIERERRELTKIVQEISDYKYALDESSILAITDQKGIITHVNENFCKISKYSKDELIGQDHRIINSGYHPKEFIKDIWKTIANGKVWKGDLKNKAKDGTPYWVETTIVPFLNDQNKPYQYVAIRADITEKKKAELELYNLNQELEAKVQSRTAELQKSLDEIHNFQSLFETIPGMFLVLLPDFTISAVTDEYLEATMLNREDIIGKYLFDVFPDNPDDPTADGVSNLHQSLDTVLKTKKSHRMAIQKYDIRRPDGTFEERSWSPINKPVLNSKNEVVYLTHGVSDVTKQLKHEAEIIRISTENLDLYNNAPCGYIAIDNTLSIVKINHTLLNLLGYSHEEVVHKMQFEDLLSHASTEVHRKNLSENFKEFVTKGYVNDREYEFQRKDKTIFPAIINATAIFNEKGEFLKSRTVVFDNTLRKKAQHELKEANAELEAQAQKLQASEEELKAQQEELMQSNAELEEKTLLLEEKNLMVNEKNEELITTAQQLAQSSRYKSEFLANMSHELRTPLNSILLLSKVLSDNHEKNLSDEQIEFARVINNSGYGLLDLINEVLDLSKIESGNMSVDIEDVQIESLCKSASDMFMPVAAERGIEFTIENKDKATTIIKTDRIRVEQVIKNFLSNAIKFTSEGSVKLIIRKPASRESNLLKINPKKYIVFEVQDTGIGIPEDKQQLVFEAFQQADGSTRRKYGGTGLGLSISKKISQLLGGDVLLKSKPGKGSSFSLIIPITEIQVAPISSNVQPITSDEKSVLYTLYENDLVQLLPAEIEDDRLTLKSGDKLILIVEDDTKFAKALMKNIRLLNYKVVVAVSGANVVEFALRYKPMGIFLDIRLPLKNGWAVLDELKLNPETRHIPVQVISAKELKRSELIERGAIDFTIKPISKKKIQTILEHVSDLVSRFPKTVLLVDNNEAHMIALKDFISSPAIKCVSGKTTSEALTLLAKKDIDCIVLDMVVPNENEYALLDALKNKPEFGNLPVVIYSGKAPTHHESKKINHYASVIPIKTAGSFNELSNRLAGFLHLTEKTGEEKNHVKPYLNENALKGKHILIVDDDVRNIFSLTKLLESQNMKVTSSIDGNEAITILSGDKSIDLVLMDMMMPNKDGYETITEIRNNSNLNQTKIIAVTAKAMSGDREKCINAGANDYITKPVDTDQLTSLLKVWLYK